jgi:hypothetical protein
MHLVLRLGFLSVLGVVAACTSPGPDTPEDSLPGAQNPTGGDPAGKEEKKPPGPTQPPNSAVAYPENPGPIGPKAKSHMTFFITSTGSGALGGNLGGLIGADKRCQDAAAAVDGADHTWHAYLSVTGTNAKDRIGTGPWTNRGGVVIAENVTALHDFLFVPPNAKMTDEKGQPVPATATSILTGSNQEGIALLQTCQDWTSNANNQQARVGEAASETSVTLGARWNSSAANNCSTQAIANNKGEGRLYCFAID